eukprot:gene12022-2607_t
MPHNLLGRKKFRSFVDVRDAQDLSDCSGSEESLACSSLGASEYDFAQDIKSSSGGTVVLKRAFSRTFSWKKKKVPCKPEGDAGSQTEKLKPKDPCKIFVIGNSGIGKTEECYRRKVNLDGGIVDLQITSMTSWGKKFDRILREAGSCIILAYSIIDFLSYCYVQKVLEEINNLTDVPVIIVGTKGDMDERRCILKSAAEKLAGDYGCVYFEVSAAANVAVQTSFEHAMRETLLDRKKRAFSTRSRSGSQMSVRRRSSVS